MSQGTKILSLVAFVRACLKQIENDDGLNLDLTQELFIEFCNKVTSDVLQDRSVCPLLTILTGLWSSYYKKERNYQIKKRDYKTSRLFLYKCLAYLLECGADPNIIHNHIHQSTPLHWLIAWDRSYEGEVFIQLVKSIQKKWCSNTLDAQNRTCLSLLVARKYFGRHQAVQAQDDQLVCTLIDEGTDLYKQDIYGNTALHYACLKRDYFCVDKILTKGGLDLLDKRNSDNLQPLQLCLVSYCKSVEYIKKVYVAAKPCDIFDRYRWEKEHNFATWIEKQYLL